jgi:hypothetical protein
MKKSLYLIALLLGAVIAPELSNAQISIIFTTETHAGGYAVPCYGETTTVTTNIIGGVAPFHYSWSNGDTISSLVSVVAGWYHLTVTDSGSVSSVTDSVNLIQPYTLGAYLNGRNVTINGGNNGWVETTRVSGGTPPYTYLWSNGETTDKIDTLTANTYTVTVTDMNSCTSTASFPVQQPSAPLSITNITATNVSCFGKVMHQLM